MRDDFKSISSQIDSHAFGWNKGQLASGSASHLRLLDEPQEGGLGEHGWMTLIMKDGAENVRYLGEGGEGGGKVDGVETDGAAADAADAIMGGFGAAAARRAKKVVEPVAERESAGGAAFII